MSSPSRPLAAALLAWAALTSPLAARAEPQTVVVKEKESLKDVARRALGDARAASELQALNGLPSEQVAPGTSLKLPGTDRSHALSALAAARNAVDQADSPPDKREQATLKLRDAHSLFRTARYNEAAKTADEAWQLVSTSARQPTRFAVDVSESGRTEVQARSGQPVLVQAAGATLPVYAGQTAKVEKGAAPGLVASPMGTPSPLAPADRERIKAGRGSVQLSWHPVKSASGYEVELTGARTISLQPDKSQVQVEGLLPGKYQWVVRAVGLDGTRSNPSPTRHFEIPESPMPLEAGASPWK